MEYEPQRAWASILGNALWATSLSWHRNVADYWRNIWRHITTPGNTIVRVAVWEGSSSGFTTTKHYAYYSVPRACLRCTTFATHPDKDALERTWREG